MTAKTKRRIGAWVRFLCALAGLGCFLAGEPVLAGFCFISAAIVSVVCGVPFAVDLVLLAPLPIAIASGNFGLGMVVGLLIMIVSLIDLHEILRLMRDNKGAFSGRAGRELFLELMSKRDVTHKLWTWFKREAM